MKAPRHYRRSIVHRLADWFSKKSLSFLAFVEGGLERIHRAKFFDPIRSLATWVRSLGSVLHWLWFGTLSAIFEASWLKGVASYLGTTKRHCAVVIDDLKLRVSKSPALSVLFSPFKRFVDLFQTISRFIIDWFATRHFRRLILGVPAIVLTVSLFTLGSRIPFHSRTAKVQHYRAAVSSAMARGDQSEIQLLFKKLNQLGDTRTESVFSRALHEYRDGKIDEAYRLMCQIAPGKEVGYGPAHLWISDTIVNNRIAVPNEDRDRLLAHHLTSAFHQLPDNPRALQRLSELCVRVGQRDAAIVALKRTPEKQLSTSDKARYASAYFQLGAYADARNLAAAASAGFREKTPTTCEEYLWWSTSEQIQSNNIEALRMLKSARQQIDDSRLQKRIEYISGTLMDVFWKAKDFERGEEIARLAIEAAPESELIQETIAKNSHHPQVSQLADELFSQLRETGRLAPRVSGMLADVALNSRSTEKAKLENELLLQEDPQNYRALNNLAWLYLTSEPNDLEKAIEYADAAAELKFENVAIRETRGQIYAKLERWSDAINDLEFALNGLPDYVPIHESLAKCYMGIGNNAMADIHKSRAMSLRDAQK